MQWKDILYFTRKERLGLITLLLLLALLLGISFLISNYAPTFHDNQTAALISKYDQFVRDKKAELDSLKLNQNKIIITEIFDPNKASLEKLKDIGVPIYIASNIINYRNKGGSFKAKEDLKKLYSISDEAYNSLREYISISPAIQPKSSKRNTRLVSKKTRRSFKQTAKYPEGTIIALNLSDTTTLAKIPGIGTYTAQKITHYRERLGGFYSISQLTEIDIDPNKFHEWFSIDPLNIHKIMINNASFKELLKHPYLSYEQVKAIFRLKELFGKIKSIKQLQFLEEFNALDIERLKYYLSFE